LQQFAVVDQHEHINVSTLWLIYISNNAFASFNLNAPCALRDLLFIERQPDLLSTSLNELSTLAAMMQKKTAPANAKKYHNQLSGARKYMHYFDN
jgi:hypothetical protein